MINFSFSQLSKFWTLHFSQTLFAIDFVTQVLPPFDLLCKIGDFEIA